MLLAELVLPNTATWMTLTPSLVVETMLLPLALMMLPRNVAAFT